MWKHTGQQRPDFAEQPGPGQESVWDYPRPPRLEPCRLTVRVVYQGSELAHSNNAARVLETASPPTIYLPPDDIALDQLQVIEGTSFCEWKGAAEYWGPLRGPQAGTAIAWRYPQINPGFASIEGFFCFYPGRVECYLGDERVRPQESGFYGGWVTDAIVGPWKGQPGTAGW